MHTLILTAILAAHPNLFEPKEMNSEDIFITVSVCMEKAMGNGSTPSAAGTMCACVVDAVRLNTKAGKRPSENNATPEQLARCHAEQVAPPQPAKQPGKVGT